MIAVLGDLSQKGEASAVSIMRDGLHAALLRTPEVSIGITIALVFLLHVLGVALCFIFEVETKRAGFYVGAGIISLMMTLVPYNPPPGVSNGVGGPGTSVQSVAVASFEPSSLVFQPSLPIVRIQIHAPAPPDEATITLRAVDGTVLGRTTYSLSLPGRPGAIREIDFPRAQGNYVISVAAPGYLTLHCSFRLPPTGTALRASLERAAFGAAVRNYFNTRVTECALVE